MSSFLPQFPMTVKRAGSEIAVTMEIRVGAPRDDVFDFVAREDVLPDLLTGYTPLMPAVVGTSDRIGPWTLAGSSRVVHLKDGNRADEEVTRYDRPAAFSYAVSNFTSALKHLASSATGEWRFRDAGAGTQVRWTYTFTSNGSLGALLLPAFARFLWSGYMRVCLDNIQRHFTGTPSRASTAHATPAGSPAG
jgi:hypothetical protein